jgi:hypothetical protein
MIDTSALQLGPFNRIASISVSLTSVALRTTSGQVWSAGAPYSPDSWTLVTSQGTEFAGRNAQNFALFALGGGMVISKMAVPNSPDNFFAQSTSTLSIVGESLGSDGDGLLVTILVWTVNPGNASLCIPKSRTTFLLVCTLLTQFAATDVGQQIQADIKIGDEMALNVTIGTVSKQPALFDSVDQLVATNADELVLTGKDFLAVVSVKLSPSGDCAIQSQTPSEIRCSISGVTIGESELLRAAVQVADQAPGSEVFQPVARAVSRALKILSHNLL